MASSTGAVVARIISQYSDKGSKAAQKDLYKLSKNIDAFAKRAVKSYAVAAAAVAAFAIKIGKDAVQGAMADEKQQASLAQALRNTTGATEAAIAANTEYLDSLELQVAIDNEKLIPALQTLVTATGDLAASQHLLTLATDVSAASGKDLQTVSVAIAKAFNGQFGALNRLGLPLDQNAIKAKDLTKILKQLAELSKGQASAAANTFAGKMETLRLKVNQVLDRIGYALMPVIEEYANYILTDIIPNVEEWIRLNEDELVKSFEIIIKSLESFAKNFYAILLFIEKYRWLIGVIAAIPFITLISNQILVLAGIARLGGKLFEAIYQIFKKRVLPIIARFGRVAAAVGSVFTTGGFGLGMRALFSALTKAIKPLGLVVGLITGIGIAWSWLSKKLGGADKTIEKSLTAQAEAARTATRANRLSREELKKQKAAQEAAAKAAREAAADAAKAAAAKAKQDKIDAQTAAIKARIEKKFGVILTDQAEQERINAAAIKKNLERDRNIEELEKFKLREALAKERLKIEENYNKVLEQQRDILQALAGDNKVTGEEVQLLAKKWQMTVEEAQAYIVSLIAISDYDISDEEIKQLADMWGMTTEEAERYYDFLRAISDGKLSNEEIRILGEKWNLTTTEVLKYASIVRVVQDNTVTDEEVQALKDQWGFTNEQVVEYLRKIGMPFNYNGSLLTGIDDIIAKWRQAIALLDEYLRKSKGSITPTVPIVPNIPVIPPVIPPIVPPSHDGTIVSDAVKAAEKIAEEIKTLTELRKDTTPGTGINFLLKEHIDALKDNTSTFSNIPVVDEQTKLRAMGMFDSVVPANFDVGSFRMAENRDFVSSTLSNASDIDERSKFRAMNTTVVVNVAGSVTTEQDLVNTVRNGLLQTQYNGNSLLLQAI